MTPQLTLNIANMPTFRHSYTLTLTDNLPQQKVDAQRKNHPHKLVSSLMGLIINPVKVSPSRLLLLQMHRYVSSQTPVLMLLLWGD